MWLSSPEPPLSTVTRTEDSIIVTRLDLTLGKRTPRVDDRTLGGGHRRVPEGNKDGTPPRDKERGTRKMKGQTERPKPPRERGHRKSPWHVPSVWKTLKYVDSYIYGHKIEEWTNYQTYPYLRVNFRKRSFKTSITKNEGHNDNSLSFVNTINSETYNTKTER